MDTNRWVAVTVSGVVLGFTLGQTISFSKRKSKSRGALQHPHQQPQSQQQERLEQAPPPLVNNATRKKVLVSGCYDLLHSGHVEFFNTAASYGDVYVCVGKDDTIEQLKGRPPMFPQEERLLMVKAIKSVFHAEYEEEGGLYGFTPNLRRIQPDIFVVNHDSSGIDDKRKLCEQEGIEFVLLPRKPPTGCAPRSSTAIKTLLKQTKEDEKSNSEKNNQKAEGNTVVAVFFGTFTQVSAREIHFLQKALVYGTELHVLLLNSTSSSKLETAEEEKSSAERVEEDSLVILKSLSIVKKVKRVGKDFRNAFKDSTQRPNILVERARNPLLPEIRKVCSESNVKLMVLDDEEHSNWEEEPPFRLCLAGGWFDQPWMSSLAPEKKGSVVVVNIFPSSFKERSGMATSSRRLWEGPLWTNRVLKREPEHLARLLFGYENPPGCEYVSGSQDHLGLCLPGISRLVYEGDYWPTEVTRCLDAATAAWLESVLVLVKHEQRQADYDPLEQKNLSSAGAGRLGRAGDQCWEAIQEKNIAKLGAALTATHDAWRELLPLTTNSTIDALCAKYAAQKDVFGQITSGAGGGYIILVTEKEIAGGFRVKIRTTWDGERV